ncbi:MAG: 3-hydroxyacyl-CoA dehydrogenase family protein [Nitrososphaerota archaeon]|jgi:3-hydroxybutyryl-CoA dehydrogenase|nr:3-hydroxyacyl-CoA dehydrogenase family protein [Nitrososphaerota archaeon]
MLQKVSVNQATIGMITNNITQVAIIGTGPIGRQLTQHIAQMGFDVILKSRSKKSLEQTMGRIKNNLSKTNMTDVNKILQKIRTTTSMSDLSTTDIVIECIIEDREAKEKLFKELDDNCSPRTILATNTSSLSVNNLTKFVSNPDRLIGTHFFNPISKMHLVEIVQTKSTSDQTLHETLDFINKIEKTAIIVNDSTGFIVNRLLFSMVNEAGYLLEEGNTTIQKIDTAMKLGANVPMGPFELADYVGIDVTYKILNELNLSLNFKRPAKIFKKMIDEGKTGRKTGEGFYKYKN